MKKNTFPNPFHSCFVIVFLEFKARMIYQLIRLFYLFYTRLKITCFLTVQHSTLSNASDFFYLYNFILFSLLYAPYCLRPFILSYVLTLKQTVQPFLVYFGSLTLCFPLDFHTPLHYSPLRLIFCQIFVFSLYSFVLLQYIYIYLYFLQEDLLLCIYV